MQLFSIVLNCWLFSMKLRAGANNQWAAHLTHSLAYELNGLPIGYLLQLVASWKMPPHVEICNPMHSKCEISCM